MRVTRSNDVSRQDPRAIEGPLVSHLTLHVVSTFRENLIWQGHVREWNIYVFVVRGTFL
jgi:hypothetical protein